MPRISVVVPIYNVEAYLAESLDVRSPRQTVSDLEVIMVDDGSTDGSAAIARELRRARPAFPPGDASPTAGSAPRATPGSPQATG